DQDQLAAERQSGEHGPTPEGTSRARPTRAFPTLSAPPEGSLRATERDGGHLSRSRVDATPRRRSVGLGAPRFHTPASLAVGLASVHHACSPPIRAILPPAPPWPPAPARS